MPIYMKCARNYTLRSLAGHIVDFQADVPRLVPDVCVDEALAVNIIPCNGENAPEAEEAAPKVMRAVAMSPELREALLLNAIHDIYREANVADFDGGQRPKAQAITERSGLEITAAERSKLWDKYRDLKATNTELPRPKNFELVADAQRLTSKRDLLLAAADLGVPETVTKGASIKEIKAAVLAAAIRHDGVVSTLDEA